MWTEISRKTMQFSCRDAQVQLKLKIDQQKIWQQLSEMMLSNLKDKRISSRRKEGNESGNSRQSRFEMLRYSVPDAMCLCLEDAHSSLIVFLPSAFLFAPCSQQKTYAAWHENLRWHHSRFPVNGRLNTESPYLKIRKWTYEILRTNLR